MNDLIYHSLQINGVFFINTLFSDLYIFAKRYVCVYAFVHRSFQNIQAFKMPQTFSTQKAVIFSYARHD